MKLIIFDLDGVLVDSCHIHYIALNKAMKEITNTEISEKDHKNIYNGLNTKTKLKMLFGDSEINTLIYNKKQKFTKEMFNKINIDPIKQNLLSVLKKKGYKLHCASNCIKETLLLILERLGIKEYFDYIISNEDVINPKPSSEMYYKCMIKENVSNKDTLIFEDSVIGIKSAFNSGANTCYIQSSEYLTIDKVNEAINYYTFNSTFKSTVNKKTYFMKNINIVIPMAGNGSRFSLAGYKNPKPLIDVNGIPMITTVIKNIGIDANYIFIIKQNDNFLDSLLQSLIPNCKIIKIKDTTEGAACTILLAKPYINKNLPLLMANCDQFLEWDSLDFITNFIIKDKHLDGLISTFKCPDKNPKWSFAKLNTETNLVCQVKEKTPISDIATTGIYLWRNGCDFVKYAEKMISKNIRHNNEFYVAPIFNEAINDNKKIGISYCNKMWGLGIPEDLDYFLKNF